MNGFVCACARVCVCVFVRGGRGGGLSMLVAAYLIKFWKKNPRPGSGKQQAENKLGKMEIN